MPDSKKLVVVAGDPICDHNFYRGTRATADSKSTQGFEVEVTRGGALLLADIIGTTISDMPSWSVESACDVNFRRLPTAYHAYCLWEPHECQVKSSVVPQVRVWRAAEPAFGFGKDDGKTRKAGSLGKPRTLRNSPDILVFDDAGLAFRDDPSRWPNSLKGENREADPWIVLKLTGPHGVGRLWTELVERHAEKLVLIISADRLRECDVRIGKGLSWEATTEDLLAELEGNPSLQSVFKARHLIVTFRSDAAIWIDNAGVSGSRRVLVFDSSRAEGEWNESQGGGGAFGFLSCFTSAVVRHMCSQLDAQVESESAGATQGHEVFDFTAALGSGLSACRKLRQVGHGAVLTPEEQVKLRKSADVALKAIARRGFQFDSITASIREPKEQFVAAALPQQIKARGSWMMLDEWHVEARKGEKEDRRPHYEAAQMVAWLGPSSLPNLPVAAFGALQTVDRLEIEGLRTIRSLMRSYQEGKRKTKPLNIGVFGPPGAGKSFGVVEIAKSVLDIKKGDVLNFNLSQFRGASELVGAFHQIRDRVLSGLPTLVFWDEFDSRNYEWLQYLLAPMQDGVFQDGQLTHPIGHCIFVFAGATSSTYEHFGPPNPFADQTVKQTAGERLKDVEKEWRDFVLKKGPDFKSRLVGYLNVLGVNQRKLINGEVDPTDVCFPIRRAFFIRGQLGVKDGVALGIDSSILRALLEVPEFKSGARSLEYLCGCLKSGDWGSGRKSALPGRTLLDMHVDADEFWRIVERDQPYRAMATALAPVMHEAYRLRIKGRADRAELDVPFSSLQPDLQLANLGQAARIPEILALVGLDLVPGPKVELQKLAASRTKAEDKIRKHIESHIERMAEAEHNGWMVERTVHGWRYARRTDKSKKLHDSLIPYCQLPDSIKAYDRLTIIGKSATADKPQEEQFGYVDVVKLAGMKIVQR